MSYTTAAAIRNYLGISATTDDTLLAQLAGAAQAWIERKTGRIFEAAADSTKYCDAITDVSGLTLRLPADLCAITTVTNGDGAAVASTKYVTNPRNATPYYSLTLKLSSALVWTYTTDPENAITIVGKWAYSATPPSDIGQAATRLAAYLYRQKDASTFDVTAQPDMGIITIPQGMPRDVAMLLAPYVRHI